jgi:hypothetical protein
MGTILDGIRAKFHASTRHETPVERAVREVRDGDLCLRRQGHVVDQMRSSGQVTAKAEGDLAKLAAAQRKNLDRLRKLVADLEDTPEHGPPALRSGHGR